MSAFDEQVGGGHYKDLPIQPITYVLANNMGFSEGSVVKYVSRWRSKGGVADLRKAKHFLEMLIEHVDGEIEPTREELISEIAWMERRLNEMKQLAYEKDRDAHAKAVAEAAKQA